MEATIDTPRPQYNYAIGYLRAFVVVLVVAHHAALAYHPFAQLSSHSLIAQPRWWQVFPIVDSHRWSGFTAFVDFNDKFFMSLMFFLSGLFVWGGLRRKHAGAFLRDRLRRLGIPFVVAAALLAPLAYYPAYLELTRTTGTFWQQWLGLGVWPAGPAWFVWVLLVFDGIAAAIFVMAPRSVESAGRAATRLSRRPVVFFALLVTLSAVVYVPMALRFYPTEWTAIGPFTFQTSRILHYLLYFLAGVCVGAGGLDKGLLASNGKLSRHWLVWVPGAIAVFILASIIGVIAITAHPQSQAWAIGAHLGFVFSCAASVFAFVAVFLRFVKSGSRFFDSLSANSYAIYLVHYAFVNWLQFFLLPAGMLALAKFGVVALVAIALSWITATALRKVPLLARVL